MSVLSQLKRVELALERVGQCVESMADIHLDDLFSEDRERGGFETLEMSGVPRACAPAPRYKAARCDPIARDSCRAGCARITVLASYFVSAESSGCGDH